LAPDYFFAFFLLFFFLSVVGGTSFFSSGAGFSYFVFFLASFPVSVLAAGEILVMLVYHTTGIGNAWFETQELVL
jgi:hypothetical protein